MYATTMTMTGRLVESPARWNVENGPKATFRLARTERRFDQAQRGWVDGASLYLSVNCWRVVAERVLATLGKGDPVIVQGRLRTREWEKDGRKHSVTELEASSVGPDLALCSVSVIRKPSGVAPSEAEVPDASAAAPAEVSPADAVAEEPPWNAGPLVEDPWAAEAERVEAGVGG